MINPTLPRSNAPITAAARPAATPGEPLRSASPRASRDRAHVVEKLVAAALRSAEGAR